jgi:hypothetical protein
MEIYYRPGGVFGKPRPRCTAASPKRARKVSIAL